MRATMRASHAACSSGGRGPSTSRGRPRTTGSNGAAAAAAAFTEELDDEELDSLLPGASDEEDDEDEGSPRFNFIRHRRKRDHHEHGRWCWLLRYWLCLPVSHHYLEVELRSFAYRANELEHCLRLYICTYPATGPGRDAFPAR